MNLKIITIIGARPQFIKASAISRVINKNYSSEINELIVHTGQHHDTNMSEAFFTDLGIPEPKYNLEISGGSHGAMTGAMLAAVENVLVKENPDVVLLYGDTNSTLAGALAAAKLHIKIAHVEAGLRSFNMLMPEEVNRVLTDRLSEKLYCPTEDSIENLANEGITRGVNFVGDVMLDVANNFGTTADGCSNIVETLGLQEKGYILATCHRAENTNDTARLRSILNGLSKVAAETPVVLAMHPRTKAAIISSGMNEALKNVIVCDPLPIFDMYKLEKNAKAICTDSGGVQKEAYFFGVPCITMRNETEWNELVVSGWNTLVKADAEHIFNACTNAVPGEKTKLYGDGNAADLIVKDLLN